MPDVLTTETTGPVRTLRLDRPDKRNALNASLVTALRRALDVVAEDEEVRVVRVTGAGSAFSAGADLSDLREMQEASPMENRRDSRRLANLFRQMYTHPAPIIAEVNGPAVGGGCGLATVCDFVVAAEDATLGFPEVRLGFVPAIVTVFVRRTLGERAARDLLLRGRLVSADTAAKMGLVTQVVPGDRLAETGDALARELATETSESALSLTKRMMAVLPGMGLDEALDYAANLNAFARGTDDCQKGIAAFLEDEDPPWRTEGE